MLKILKDFVKIFEPAPTPPHKPKWYAMSLEKYQEYDKDFLRKCASVIEKNIYHMPDERYMVVYFDGRVDITDCNHYSAMKEMVEIKDPRVIANLNRKYKIYMEKEARDYKRLVLAEENE